MKAKINRIVVLLVLAATGIIIFQISWLKNSYTISKEKITVEVRDAFDEAILRHQALIEDSVRNLLISTIRSQDIETRVFYNNPDSQNVSLHYRTKRYPNGSWVASDVNRNNLKKIAKNPYPLLLENINNANLEKLHGIYSSFVGIVHYTPNSLEDKRQDSLARYFDYHQDTLTLHKILGQLLGDFGKDLRLKVSYSKIPGDNPVPGKPISVSSQIDSLNTYIQRLNQKGDDFYIAKPILGTTTAILVDGIPVLVLQFNIPRSLIFQEMMYSFLGSGLLLAVICFCLVYMLKLILKQKKLAEIKDDFISNVSHELKTPVATTLAAIQGMQYFDILKNKEKTDQYLTTASNEMKRLSNMIDGILNAVAYELDDFKLNLTPFDLKEMLTEIFELQELHAKKQVHISLTYNCTSKIIADRTLLYQVILNFIDNAIKYSNEFSEITVLCTAVAKGISIQIKDNGIGIPLIHQEHVFDKFFRVPSPNDHRIKGFGLGLSYVKNIIEKHNGKVILIESNSTGSTFEITLPQ